MAPAAVSGEASSSRARPKSTTYGFQSPSGVDSTRMLNGLRSPGTLPNAGAARRATGAAGHPAAADHRPQLEPLAERLGEDGGARLERLGQLGEDALHRIARSRHVHGCRQNTLLASSPLRLPARLQGDRDPVLPLRAMTALQPQASVRSSSLPRGRTLSAAARS